MSLKIIKIIPLKGPLYTECLKHCLFRTEELLRHLLPRMARLGIKVGLRLIGSVKTGSVYDGTCVIGADEVDILVMFDTYQVPARTAVNIHCN